MSERELTFSANGINFDLKLDFAGNATSGAVIGISGTVGTHAVTGLDASYESPDNIVSSSYPYVDYNGLSFDTSDDQLNLYNLNGSPVVVDQQYFGGGGATVDNLTETACYLWGACVATDRDEVPVQDLKIGDNVVTASGATRPIKWIGSRAYSARFARNNPGIHPICFKAGSLKDNIPTRDLWVSPKHAMFLDGVLIPAELLVNGVTIVQPAPCEDVRYFHVELASHDVLIVNGAASESFLDDDSRAMFQNAATYATLYPGEPQRAVGFCAPRVEDGYAFERVWRRLAQRAGLAVAAS